MEQKPGLELVLISGIVT